jgi:putative ABC transport system substrate-binding protein
MVEMRRRKFMALLAGAAAARPFAARAQKSAVPVIGVLHSAAPATFIHFVNAFRSGLKEKGFIEDQTVRIEQRWAEGQYDRLPALAADLVKAKVEVIAAMGGEGPALAAKGATATIPIIFLSGGDPVKLGLVASLNKPSANVTGINQFTTALESKRFGLLHEMVPNANPIAVLLNSTRAVSEVQTAEVRRAAARLGLGIVLCNAASQTELETAFLVLAGQRISALQVAADPFFFSRRHEITALAERYRVPALYEFRQFTDVGGLMSYGTDLAESYRLAGIYTGRVLKGETPAELPVLQPTKFELVINLKTAKALDLTIPPGVLAIADEVIE